MGLGRFVGGIFRTLFLHRSSLYLRDLFFVLRIASELLALSVCVAMSFPLKFKTDLNILGLYRMPFL